MPESPHPFLTLQQVTLRLYGRLLFEGTDWEIRDDQQWAVVGPNASGKTTLVRAIAGQVPVVHGEIVYHWAKEGTLPHREVAYAAFDSPGQALRKAGHFYQARWNTGTQETALSVDAYLSEQNVKQINPFQVVEETPDPARYAAHRARVVRSLGIEDLLEKELIQLSNGERRKVSIARALLKEPRLLILDNPLAGLDDHARETVTQLLQTLTQDRVRVIVVAAQMDSLPAGFTHTLRVEGCRVVAREPTLSSATRSAPKPGADVEGPPAIQPIEVRDLAPRTRFDTPSDPFLVQVQGANVSYGGKRILCDVDWTIRRGEHWALLGPNGSGKTTLLSLLVGDHPQAYANRISLFGRRRGSGESIWQIKERIGWVTPQLQLYYPHRTTAFDVVCSGYYDSVGLYNACSPSQKEHAREWMERLGIAHHAGTSFASISEGEQRIVLLARALVKTPQLLVLDEPCQGLDAHNRERVLHIVESAGRQLGTHVIHVTHDTDQLPAIITHVLRLDHGRVVYSGRLASHHIVV